MRPLYFLAGLTCSSAFLLACSALLGVEDVDAQQRKVGNVEGGSSGSLPPGDPFEKPVPLPPGALPPTDTGELALGFLHGCARTTKGKVLCWGDDGAGQLGDPATHEDIVTTPLSVDSIGDAIQIAAGSSHTCIIHAGGAVSCWGYNFFGQLGNNTKEKSPTPVDVMGLTDAKQLSLGQSFSCALKADKTVACWGIGDKGELGDEAKVERDVATPLPGGPAGVAQISAGNEHVCAALEDGSVMCWGNNDNSQLGVDAPGPIATPFKVQGLANIKQVAAGVRFTCALETGGRVLCWGTNQYGILANGGVIPTTSGTPVPIPGVKATTIWAGNDHVCAVLDSGGVSCWGHDTLQASGAGAIPTPTPVAGISGAKKIWTGGNRSCAQVADQKVLCWGKNDLGALGSGAADDAPTPVPLLNFP